MDCSLPGSSVHGILQQEHWREWPSPPIRDLPNPGIEPASLMSLTLADGFFNTSATWEVPNSLTLFKQYLIIFVFTS